MSLLRQLIAQLFTAGMILVGLLIDFHYDWPDYVHTDYGVPLPWTTHAESAITGPVDIWRVNATNLILDVAIWTILSLALVALISALKHRARVA
jgi:hypothetical protein